MRKLANLFLLLFVATATLGIADEILHLSLGLHLLTGLQQLFWLGSIAVGTIVYLGLGFNRHLPKTILIPLFIWLFWSLIDYWPVENIAGNYFKFCTSGGQLLLGLAMLRLNRQRNHKSLLLVRSQFSGAPFSGRNLLRFSLISLLVVPVALHLISYSLVGNLIKTNTAGFVQLKPNGLYMTERVYQQNEKQIRLVGMIHLGEEEFYDDLTASIPGHQTLILAEGVSDKGHLLTEQFSYGRIANLLGLTSQEKINFPGKLIEVADLDDKREENQEIPDILRADIDLQQFDSRTLEVLNAMAKYLLNGESLVSGYMAFNRWAEEHFSPDLNEIVMTDLISKRNRSVLGYLPKALNRYDTVIIPWGALHMQGIEKAVLATGFQLKKSQTRQSINFLSLPYQQLWKKIRGTVQPADANET